jgi:hypothetical protein
MSNGRRPVPVPAGEHGPRRVIPRVTDVRSSNQLLSYAIAGQLALLKQHLPGIPESRVAYGAGLGANPRAAAPALTVAVRDGPTPRQLEGIDEVIGALIPQVERTGGLCSLAWRLSMDSRDKIPGGLGAHIPPNWTKNLLHSPPTGDVGVLVQASAFLSAFVAADKADPGGGGVNGILDHYGEQAIDRLARQLILISVAPPSTMYYDAPILLGSLASYAFETMRGRLDRELRFSPLGFRVWRAVTQLVKLSHHADLSRSGRSEHTAALRAWVRGLIRDSGELREKSLFPGRSFDLELAISIPADWSRPGDDWVHDALFARAMDREATLRERGTAAMGLWERAISEGHASREKAAENELRRLIATFRSPDTRPDVAPGLRWVAATLECAIDQRVSVCNKWPDIDEPWFKRVGEAANQLDQAGIPDHLRDGTKSLFRHMVLQNAGVYRRHAIETVGAAGLGTVVADALGFLLEHETEAWLRIRAEFALSFLQQRDPMVEEHLIRACEQAYKVLQQDGMAQDGPPPRSHVTEMHSSLFAVGDCFGVAGAEDQAKRVRERLRPILADLASMEGDRADLLRRAARAAAYLLIVTAQPASGTEMDLSQELLQRLSHHPDEVTAGLSRWALGFRFRSDGGISPLIDAE